jgi:hypothetical protein
LLLPLIEAIYDPNIPLPENPEFYTKAIKDIEHFAISPQIYHLLNQNGQLYKTPLFFQDRLKQAFNKTLFQNILMRNKTLHVLAEFENHEIQVIPLKGVLFSERYFGHLGARGTSDIDLLIKEIDLARAIACVKSLGYTLESEHIPSHFHCSFSKRIPNSPVPLTIELHWDLLKENTSSLKIDEFWNQAKPYKHSTFIKELSDYHTFYMICLHGWRHHLNSLKHLFDIIQLIHMLHDKLDYELFRENAGAHKTLKRMNRTLGIVYYFFPSLQQVKPFSANPKKNLWWEYRAIRDKNYRTLKKYFNLFQFQLFDFDSPKHSLFALYHWIQGS